MQSRLGVLYTDIRALAEGRAIGENIHYLINPQPFLVIRDGGKHCIACFPLGWNVRSTMQPRW